MGKTRVNRTNSFACSVRITKQSKIWEIARGSPTCILTAALASSAVSLSSLRVLKPRKAACTVVAAALSCRISRLSLYPRNAAWIRDVFGKVFVLKVVSKGSKAFNHASN
jgi:hypothetical protein